MFVDPDDPIFDAKAPLLGVTHGQAASRKRSVTDAETLGKSQDQKGQAHRTPERKVRTPRMKIYLGFTVAGDRSSLEAAKKILAALESLGHEVLTRHLVREDAWEADRRVPPREIFARDMKWLNECDLFLAEVSGSSFGLGFETGYLLGATQRKTILFYDRSVERRISLLITGNTHPSCVLVPYSRLDELEDLVRGCVGDQHPFARE